MSSPFCEVGRKGLSPRVQLAIRLYKTAVCKTQREASAAAGLHPMYLTMLLNQSIPARQFASQVDQQMEISTLSTSKLIEHLSRKAVERLGHLMQNADKEEVQLRAAIDLADRGPETQKVQRHEITGLSLASEDVSRLAQAMVESAQVRESFVDAVQKDFIPKAEDNPRLLPDS